jgi:hypothetical protein
MAHRSDAGTDSRVTQEIALSYVGEHALGLPKSY